MFWERMHGVCSYKLLTISNRMVSALAMRVLLLLLGCAFMISLELLVAPPCVTQAGRVGPAQMPALLRPNGNSNQGLKLRLEFLNQGLKLNSPFFNSHVYNQILMPSSPDFECGPMGLGTLVRIKFLSETLLLNLATLLFL